DDDTWIIESLLRRSRENREAGYERPFASVLATPHIVRDIIDEHVGEMFAMASIKIGPSRPEPAGVEDKQLVYEEKRQVGFNEDLFRYMPIVDDYGHTNTIRKWHSKLWTPIRRKTEVLHNQLLNHEPLDYREAQDLGRMLRSVLPSGPTQTKDKKKT
ncbi:MAG TPA: hypothetical protein VD706_02530, partial [Candidatus Saccharimonadales bacterium]|nr:hypothetical protein [Candidatus Saccharimonadales bacterium]